MIVAISWVPKEVSKPVSATAIAIAITGPSNEDEIDNALKRRESEEETEKHMDVEAAHQALAAADALGRTLNTNSEPMDVADSWGEIDMKHYDEEDDGIDLIGKTTGDLYYASNDLDPHLKDKDDDDSELEDMFIRATDSVIVCARSDGYASQLEVWVCEDEDEDDADLNMYVHHDFFIPESALCTAWLDCPLKGGEKGNFIAVGSRKPAIEIWDLDIIDEVEPVVVLGCIVEKKGKKASAEYKMDSHTKSVLGLAWNREYRNILASASADKQVKIWDVTTGKCKITMDHHTDKVQAVAWNHCVPQVLLSGSFDRTVVMKDGRAPSHPGFKWSVPANVESLAWDPHTEHSFVVSLKNGTIQGFDIRTANSDPYSKPSFDHVAHAKSVCTVSYNPSAPNLLATGSSDKMVKLWDLSNNQPSCIASKDPKAGAIFFISFSEDSPFLLAIGGYNGKLDVWDTLTDAGVARKFGKYSNRNISKPKPDP